MILKEVTYYSCVLKFHVNCMYRCSENKLYKCTCSRGPSLPYLIILCILDIMLYNALYNIIFLSPFNNAYSYIS